MENLKISGSGSLSERQKIESMDDALKYLGEISSGYPAEVKNRIYGDLDEIKNLMLNSLPVKSESFQELKLASEKAAKEIGEKLTISTREATDKLNNSARQNPWYYVGGAALIASTLGFVAGRKSNHHLRK